MTPSDDDGGPLSPGTYEGEKPYDGPFSTYFEWHAFTHGLYAGLRTRPTTVSPPVLPPIRDVQKEPHYFKGGFIVGVFAQWALMFLAGAGIISGSAGVAGGVGAAVDALVHSGGGGGAVTPAYPTPVM